MAQERVSAEKRSDSLWVRHSLDPGAVTLSLLAPPAPSCGRSILGSGLAAGFREIRATFWCDDGYACGVRYSGVSSPILWSIERDTKSIERDTKSIEHES